MFLSLMMLKTVFFKTLKVSFHFIIRFNKNLSVDKFDERKKTPEKKPSKFLNNKIYV